MNWLSLLKIDGAGWFTIFLKNVSSKTQSLFFGSNNLYEQLE